MSDERRTGEGLTRWIRDGEPDKKARQPPLARVAQHPLLLDELLVARNITNAPPTGELHAELGQLLARAERDGAERVLDMLREFKQSHVFRVAASSKVICG